MRLQLVSIDAPEPENGYYPDYIQDKDQTFHVQRVLIDNHQFQNCKFEACTFVYSGGPFGFDECTIDGETTLVLTGAARRARLLWKALEERPERLSPAVF
jgi:hypothetical protein